MYAAALSSDKILFIHPNANKAKHEWVSKVISLDDGIISDTSKLAISNKGFLIVTNANVYNVYSPNGFKINTGTSHHSNTINQVNFTNNFESACFLTDAGITIVNDIFPNVAIEQPVICKSSLYVGEDLILNDGDITNAGKISTGTLTLANGSITDTSGSISFGNENLSTTGAISASSLSLSSKTLDYIFEFQQLNHTIPTQFGSQKLWNTGHSVHVSGNGTKVAISTTSYFQYDNGYVNTYKLFMISSVKSIDFFKGVVGKTYCT